MSDTGTEQTSANLTQVKASPKTVKQPVDMYSNTNPLLQFRDSVGNRKFTEIMQQNGLSSVVVRGKQNTASSSNGQESDKAQAARIYRELVTRYDNEARNDAAYIASIFNENLCLWEKDEKKIMVVIEKWAAKPSIPGARMSAFDYFIVASRQKVITTRIMGEYTSVFDEIHRRLSSERVEKYKNYIKTKGATFKDEKQLELAKFEIDREQALEVLQAGAETVAAVATGGGSVLIQIGAWLATTLPDLIKNARSIFSFIDTIKSIKMEDIKRFFSPKGLGELLVNLLFGEIRMLPEAREDSEEKEAEDRANARNTKGFIKALQLTVKIIKGLKKVYDRVASVINNSISAMDITKKKWFPGFSMVYAGLFKVMELSKDPAAIIRDAVGKIRETVGDFFGSIKQKVKDTAGKITDFLTALGKPSEILAKLADKAVEMVLNFIITHPPSALVKSAFKMIQAGTGKSMVELVRQHIPFADELIDKISKSQAVNNLIKPLNPYISAMNNTVEKISGEAGGLIGEAESKAMSFMGDGVKAVGEMTGININTVEGKSDLPQNSKKTPKSDPKDFIGVVKGGIHKKLIAIGEGYLIQKAKDLGSAALDKGENAIAKGAQKIKGILFGGKNEFKVNGEDHEIWAEAVDNEPIIYIASNNRKKLIKTLEEYWEAINKLPESEKKKACKIYHELEKHTIEALNIVLSGYIEQTMEIQALERKITEKKNQPKLTDKEKKKMSRLKKREEKELDEAVALEPKKNKENAKKKIREDKEKCVAIYNKILKKIDNCIIRLENYVAVISKKRNANKAGVIEVKYGEHFTRKDGKKVLKPNVKYVTKERYTYITDSAGRIVSIEGNLKIGLAKRNRYAQRNVGKPDRHPTDDGGHLIASIFKGSGDIDNMVPMDGNLNKGEWKRLENTWREALESGETVSVSIMPIYGGNSLRPAKFQISYKIGKDNYLTNLKNSPGGK